MTTYQGQPLKSVVQVSVKLNKVGYTVTDEIISCVIDHGGEVFQHAQSKNSIGWLTLVAPKFRAPVRHRDVITVYLDASLGFNNIENVMLGIKLIKEFLLKDVEKRAEGLKRLKEKYLQIADL